MMRLKNHKIFARLTILILLCAFLTFNVGKVQKTYALSVVTTAAASAALTIGATYLVYITLTGGTLEIPSASEIAISDYLSNVGHEAIERSPYLQKQYNKMYQYCLDHPNDWTSSLILDFDQDLLKGVYNDLKSIDTLQEIGSYSYELDSLPPSVPFDYTFEIREPLDHVYRDGFWTTKEVLINYGNVDYYLEGSGPRVVILDNTGGASLFHLWDTSYEYRNYYRSGAYGAEYLDNGVWHPIGMLDISLHGISGINTRYLSPFVAYGGVSYQYYHAYSNSVKSTLITNAPPIADAGIYDYDTDTWYPAEIVDTHGNRLSPNWNYPDEDPELPFVPFVQLPHNINSPSSLDKWGIKWSDLWSRLQDLAGLSLQLDAIRALINSLAADTVINISGDYLPYNDNDTNYFQYFDNSYNYEYAPIYNYYIGDQEDVIPVNLNEISQYTDNDYLDQIKEAAVNGGNVIRDYFVFWYNISPELVYALFGSFILILIGAFIGKWGHS